MRRALQIVMIVGLAGTALPVPAKTLLTETVGTTKSCLANRDIRAKRLSSETGYFAQTRSGWWHNIGKACPAYGADRALVTRSTVDRQCSGDLVSVFDTFSRIEYGACALGRWEKVAGPPPVAGKAGG